MAELEDLAKKYGCDKFYFHSYIPFYKQLFEGMEVKRLLEIGIGHEGLMKDFTPFYVHGASLLMWQDYLPNAKIFACDIRPDTLVNDGNINSWLCDQSSPESLAELVEATGGHYDVVIDDGSHVPEHQATSLEALLPHLNPGGAYVVEDVWAAKGQVLADRFGGKLWKGANGGDDNLVVVRKELD